MSHHETPESIEADRDAANADHEGRASDAAYEQFAKAVSNYRANR